jgi:hypothetical protein
MSYRSYANCHIIIIHFLFLLPTDLAPPFHSHSYPPYTISGVSGDNIALINPANHSILIRLPRKSRVYIPLRHPRKPAISLSIALPQRLPLRLSLCPPNHPPPVSRLLLLQHVSRMPRSAKFMPIMLLVIYVNVGCGSHRTPASDTLCGLRRRNMGRRRAGCWQARCLESPSAQR